ncbi:MAG: hypothetical protein AAB590_02330 [Patescibacteria group bacterium]
MGQKQYIPYITAFGILGAMFYLVAFARITRGATGPRHLTAGEPLLVLAIDRVTKARYLLAGVPFIIGLYTSLVPMDTHPRFIIFTVIGVMGMICYSSALDFNWPWPKFGRGLSIVLFFATTGAYIFTWSKNHFDHEKRASIADETRAWKSGDDEKSIREARQAKEAVEQTVRNLERAKTVVWKEPAIESILTKNIVPASLVPVKRESAYWWPKGLLPGRYSSNEGGNYLAKSWTVSEVMISVTYHSPYTNKDFTVSWERESEQCNVRWEDGVKTHHPCHYDPYRRAMVARADKLTFFIHAQ